MRRAVGLDQGAAETRPGPGALSQAYCTRWSTMNVSLGQPYLYIPASGPNGGGGAGKFRRCCVYFRLGVVCGETCWDSGGGLCQSRQQAGRAFAIDLLVWHGFMKGLGVVGTF